MKSLSNFITESLSINEQNSNDLKSLRMQFKLLFKQLFDINIKHKSGSNYHHEIARHTFDSQEEAYRMLSAVVNEIEDTKVLSEKPQVFGRVYGTSGSYFSYAIEHKGEVYYFCDTNTLSSNNSVLRKKFLTPDNLNLGGNVYKSFNELSDAVVRSLETLNVDKSITSFLKNIIQRLAEHKHVKYHGSFGARSFDEYILDRGKGRAEIDLEGIYFKEILDGDIRNIECDFGEVLGPLMFFTLFDGIEVYFPDKSNEPMVDYYINGYKFSAKQLSGGAKPAGTDIMRKAKYLNDLSSIDKKIDNLTPKQEDIIFTAKEQQFIDDIAHTFDMSTFQQQSVLISKFLKTQKVKLNNLLSFLDLPTYKHYNDMTHDLDKYFNNDKEKINSFFSQLYEITNYTPKYNNNTNIYTPKNIAEMYDRLDSITKYGILFYPMWNPTVKNINDIYRDEITSVFNKVIDMKQVYFGFKSDDMIFEAVSSAASAWEFAVGGISTNRINNAKLSVQIKK